MTSLKVYSEHYGNDKQYRMYRGNEYPNMKNDIQAQDAFFKEGLVLKKTSDNKYFNRSEILLCVGIHKGIAYFTTERLKSIHERYNKKGEYPLAGIPLEHEEAFELVTEKAQRIRVLKDSLKRAKNSKKKVDEELKRNLENQKQLLKMQGELEDSLNSFEKLSKSIELEIRELSQ